MSEPTEPVPPTSAAPIGTEHGTVRYSVPETTRLLGISERAVRKRITAGSLDAHKEGNAWVVLLPATKGAVPAAPAAQETVPEAAPVSGTATSDVHEAVIQLRTLLAEERQRADRYLEASTIWQGRALQLEERLKALEAGPIAGDVDQAAGRIHESGHQPSHVAAEAAETTRPAWRRWWRMMTGGAVDLS
jgi:hypothetical protein